MNGENTDLQTLTVEFRTFVAETNLKLESIDERLSYLTSNSRELQALARNTELMQKENEQRWRFHHEKHAMLSEETGGDKKRPSNWWLYALIAIISGVAGERVINSVLELLAF